METNVGFTRPICKTRNYKYAQRSKGEHGFNKQIDRESQEMGTIKTTNKNSRTEKK